jgi:hypothetical protein
MSSCYRCFGLILLRGARESTRKRPPPEGAACFKRDVKAGSTLTGFETLLCFVDHVNAAFATHNTAVAVPVLERAE